MKLQLLAPILLFLALPLAAQSTAALVYAESFRQGSTRIVEQSFEAKLTPQDSVYRERIKDSHGDDRYIFSLLPLGPEDNEITSWQAKLADLHHPIYDNILLTSPQPSDDPKNVANDALWRLEPGNYAPVPARARRIIKVDTFYVVLQVRAFHFTPPDSPYLDSMTVDVAFSNTDPRPPDGPPK